MSLNRRALLSGGAISAIVLVTNQSFAAEATPWYWRKYNGDPFVKNDGRSDALREAEAMRRQPEALVALGVRKELRAGFVELVRKNPKGMRQRVHYNNGMRLTAMMSGSGVERNVEVAFNEVVPGKVGASAYAREWDLEDETLVLFEICFNWSFIRKEKHCFEFKVDGREYPVKNPLQVVVSFYGIDDWRKLAVDHCFYAVDGATGERLSLVHECLVCLPSEQEAIWPEDVPVDTKTQATFTVVRKDGSIGFPSGFGSIFVPRWAESSVRFCFVAIAKYIGKAPSWSRQSTMWQYSSYYHLVNRAEFAADLKAGKYTFRRTIVPNGVLGR